MNSEQLEAIRGRVEPTRGKRMAWYEGQHIDAIHLLDEVDRLREALEDIILHEEVYDRGEAHVATAARNALEPTP